MLPLNPWTINRIARAYFLNVYCMNQKKKWYYWEKNIGNDIKIIRKINSIFTYNIINSINKKIKLKRIKKLTVIEFICKRNLLSKDKYLKYPKGKYKFNITFLQLKTILKPLNDIYPISVRIFHFIDTCHFSFSFPYILKA